MRKRGENSGFTLIELSIVLAISGIMMAFAIQAYRVYVNQSKYQATFAQLNTLQTTINAFENARNRLPCPSDPSLPVDDPNAGVELCVYYNGLWALYQADGAEHCNPVAVPFLNSVAKAMCVEPGGRRTLGNTGPAGQMDAIFIGGMPFKSMKSGIEPFTSGCPDANHLLPPMGTNASGLPDPVLGTTACTGANINNSAKPDCIVAGTTTADYCDYQPMDGVLDAKEVPAVQNAVTGRMVAQTGADFVSDAGLSTVLDPWSYQFSYVVSGLLTNAITYTAGNGEYGAINVQDEAGANMVSPADTANFVIISHGDDHSGAYTAQGGIPPNPCATTAAQGLDWQNCNNGFNYVQGLRSDAPGVTHLDDAIIYTSVSVSKLWDIVAPGSMDIYNKNIQNVGIGTTALPNQKLEVAGSIYVNGESGTGLQISPINSQSPNSALPAADQGQGVACTTNDFCSLQTNICDNTGSNCWSPSLIGGYNGTNPADPGNPHCVLDGNCPATMVPSGNLCPTAPAGSAYLVTGIVNGKVTCSATPVGLINPQPNQTCSVSPNLYVTGFTAAGLVICGPLP